MQSCLWRWRRIRPGRASRPRPPIDLPLPRDAARLGHGPTRARSLYRNPLRAPEWGAGERVRVCARARAGLGGTPSPAVPYDPGEQGEPLHAEAPATGRPGEEIKGGFQVYDVLAKEKRPIMMIWRHGDSSANKSPKNKLEERTLTGSHQTEQCQCSHADLRILV